MTDGRRQRSTRSRVLWGVFGILLLVSLVLLYFQLGVQPSLWEVLTNSADM